jgi:hypothetical protein
VDTQGVAEINVTDYEYQIRVTHPDYTKLELDDVIAYTIEGEKLSMKDVLDA